MGKFVQMNRFVLVANSTIDETAEYFEVHNIKCACLSFTIDGRTVKEDFGKTIPYHEFYDMLRAGKQSTTSQAQVSDYLEIFREACAEGLDVVYIGFSSGLSGSYDAGCMAAEEVRAQYPDRVIRCVDTLAAAGGECVLVEEARKLRDNGASADECADAIEALKLRVVHMVTVDDLNHLWRGGRVSRASAVLGTLAGVKPIIYLDNEGKLQVCQKIRGRRKALEYIADEMLRQMGDNLDQVLRVSHGDCEEDARYTAEYLERHGAKHVEIRMIDTVIGSHTGPGVMTIFGIGKERRPF